MGWLSSLAVGTFIHFFFKDGNDLRVPYKKATAEKTQDCEWTAKTESGIVEVYPSEDHPENFTNSFIPITARDGGLC